MMLRGKVALVTGAARRLGREISLGLAREGADVILHSNKSSTEGVAEAIEREGRRTWAIRADLAIPDQVETLAQEALRSAGHIDILVNNASAFYATPLENITSEVWEEILQVNLSSPFLLSLLLGRKMREKARGDGKIIFLGDWSGRRPSRNYLAYCVSKAGVHALTRSLAKALAPEVQVNEVAPGPVLLPDEYTIEQIEGVRVATPLERLGVPDDVVRTVLFLAKPGSYVTGASYVVDGGWLAKGGEGNVIST